MKKFALISVLLVVCSALWAGWDFGASLDIGTVQDVFLSKGSYQFNIDLRSSLEDKFELRMPVSFTFKNEDNYLEAGLDVAYYPYESGFFVGMSVFDFGLTVGSQVLSVDSLSEMMVGWTFKFPFGMYLEPCLVIRNPGDTYSEEYKNLLGRFNSYGTFRFRAIFGWKFLKGEFK